MEKLIDMPNIEVLDALIHGKVTGENHVVFDAELNRFEYPIPLPETPHRVRRMPTQDQLFRYLDNSKPPFVTFNLKTGEFEG